LKHGALFVVSMWAWQPQLTAYSFLFFVYLFFSVFYSIIMLFGFAVVCGALCASDFLEGFQFVPRLLLNCLPLLLPVFQSFVCIL